MNTLFLDALAGKNVSRPPVWIMRQAGRYSPIYQGIRKTHSIETLFHDPELIAKVTKIPLDEIGVDAAILFSDILLVLETLGCSVTFPKGGPKVLGSITDKEPDMEKLSFIESAISLIKKDIKVPLIGFCGGPFTVATYYLGSREKALELIEKDPETMLQILEKITDASEKLLSMQRLAGCDALQIFESWGSSLTNEQFRVFCLPFLKRLTKNNTIVFSRETGRLHEEIKKINPSGISFDADSDLSLLEKTLDASISIQGNISPEVLLGSKDQVVSAVKSLLSKMQGSKRFIMNLGHGVLPNTPVENVKAFVETVTTWQEGA